MSLIKCKACGHEISKEADKCPSCGHPVKKADTGSMAALVAIFVIIAVIWLIPDGDKAPPAPKAPELQPMSVPPELLESISSGLQQPFVLRHAFAAKSEVHEKVYFVAAELVGPGANGQVGLWARIGDLNGNGLIHSVNGYAIDFSDWPDSSTTKANISRYDSPAQQLVSFVQEQVRVTQK